MTIFTRFTPHRCWAAMFGLIVALSVGAVSASAIVTGGWGEPPAKEPFRLNLPEWNPDPEDLPPELRPLDVVRPVLPNDIAAEVTELESRIAELERLGLSAETCQEQDAALDEAIELAERVLVIRSEHQGNTQERVRWQDADGEPSEWYELIDSRRKIRELCLLRRLGRRARDELAVAKDSGGKIDELYAQHRYNEALALNQDIIEIRIRLLGGEHFLTIESTHNMGAIFMAMGEHAEAEIFLHDSLKASRKVLGNEHPATLHSLSIMGELYRSRGQHAQSEMHLGEAMGGSRRILGDDHYDTIRYIIDLADFYTAQERSINAEPYLRFAIESRRSALGDEHLSTLRLVVDLAMMLYNHGRHSEAEVYFREALGGRRIGLGDKHPDTLVLANMLGNLCNSRGRYEEAEFYFRIGVRAGCPMSLRNLANFLRAQNRLGEAAVYYMDLIEHSRSIRGDMAYLIHEAQYVAEILFSQGRLADAEPYFREMLEDRQRVLGGEHPDTLESARQFGAVLRHLGHWAEAEVLLQKALCGFRDDTKVDTRKLVSSINSMAVLRQHQGRYFEAEALLREALEICRVNFGDDHAQTILAVSNIGVLLQSQGRLAEAEPYSYKAMRTRLRLLGINHPDTLLSYSNTGTLLLSSGNADASKLYFSIALSGMRDNLGERHPYTLVIANNFASAIRAVGKLQEALVIQERIHTILLQDLGKRHPYTNLTAVNLAITYAELGDVARASSLLSEVVSGSGFLRLAESLPMLGREDRMRRIEEHARSASLLVALSLATGEAKAGLSGVLSSKNILMASARSEGSTLRSLGDPEVDRLLAQLAAEHTNLAALTAHASSLDPGRPVMNAETLRQQSAEIDAKIRRLERELRDRSPEYRRRAALQTLGVGELADLLGPDEALVEYMVYRPLVEAGPDEGERRYVSGDPHYAAFVLRSSGDGGPQVHAFDLGPAEEIDGAIAAWRGDLETFICKFNSSRGSVGATDILRSELAMAEHGLTLRERLWDPLSEVLAGSERVFVSPDGPVSALPLEALPTEQVEAGYRYLIETGPSIVYLGGGRDLAESRLVVEGAERGQPGPALLVGDPDFDAGPGRLAFAEPRGLDLARQRWAPLMSGGTGTAWPALGPTSILIETVAESLRGLGIAVRQKTRADATASVVRSAGAGLGDHDEGSPSVLLIATHGQYLRPEEATPRAVIHPGPAVGRSDPLSDPMLWSRLVFAGVNTSPDEQSVLTAREAALLDLRQTDLVLLVACHSGEGDALASGQGVAGLRSSFLLSGARRVVSTLFEVPTNETVDIMRGALAGHAPEAAGLDERLREAKLKVIGDYRETMHSGHPFFWAGPTLAGDPGAEDR